MEQYDYSKLRGAIIEEFGNQNAFAEALGMSGPTLSLKLNNKAEWGQDEMVIAMNLLKKPLQAITDYFFTHAV